MIQVLRESKEPPAEVQERITRAGGVNRFGEPNFRVVWGWSRLTWIGGKWTDRDSNGNIIREVIELREEPKYIPHDRWHIERWVAPEQYGTPQSWNAETVEREDGIAVSMLGPFPARGDYELSFTLETPNGNHLPLTPSICDAVVRAVEWSRRQTPEQHKAALVAREERRQRDWEKTADAILGS